MQTKQQTIDPDQTSGAFLSASTLFAQTCIIVIYLESSW